MVCLKENKPLEELYIGDMTTLQRKKHPRFRKKEPDKMKRKKDVIKNTKNKDFLELIPHLPQDVKNIIYTMVMKDRIPSWRIEHEKRFYPSSVFLSSGIDIFYHYGYRLLAGRDMFPISSKKEKIYNLNSKCSWSMSNLMLELPPHDWSLNPVVPKFHLRPICLRQADRKSQSGIKSVFIKDNTCKHIVYREWSNKPWYYWYHEKCRCIVCDLVKYHGRSNLSIKEAEKYKDITWKDSSIQWKTKSVLERKYENNFAKIMVWSLLVDFWNEY